MLVNFPQNQKPESPRILGDIKAGKTVSLASPDGAVSMYLVCRATKVENIDLPFERTMLANVATGRIVFKFSKLPVYELSAKVNTKYLYLAEQESPNETNHNH